VSRPLILASTSKYRAELLARLRMPFETRAPHVDEDIGPDEPAAAAAARLARAKAEAVATATDAIATDAIVIGADQIPSLDGKILRKPGHHRAALEQLEACRGRTVVFHTAAAVIDGRDRSTWSTVDTTEVDFARLDRDALDRYLALEQPYDCAGGFKAEGLGIILFSAIRSADPTALIGLPMIWVAATLRRVGLDPLELDRAPAARP
jgi:septum formation protein